MAQPEDGAFGRRGEATGFVASGAQWSPPARQNRGGPLLGILDRVFLWIPNERAPGFPAVCVFLLRQTIAPLVLIVGLFAVFALAMPKANLIDRMGKAPSSIFVLLLVVLLSIDAVQELNRYAFVRRADRPARALIVFTAAAIGFVIVFYHDNLYALCAAIVAQVAASAAMFYGLRFRRYIAGVIVAIIIGHTAVYAIAAQLIGSAPAAGSKKDVAASASPTAPDVGGMRSWAKLYPGAVVTESGTSNLLGLTSWKVTYTAQASSDQIDSFYEGVASDLGFNDRQSLAGLHVFRQEDTHNDFRYAVISDPSGSKVLFEARTFGGPGPSN
jgi:hypothetical protein